MFKLIKLPTVVLTGALLFLAVPAQATIITIGSLTTDTPTTVTSQIITDSLNNLEWLRFDLLKNETYAQTLAAITSGAFIGQGWQIAHNAQAQLFADAMLGTPNGCTTTGTAVCGTPAYTNGDFGDDHLAVYDYAFFLSDNGVGQQVGLLGLKNLELKIYNEYASIAASDTFATGGANANRPISWLLSRSTVTVPEPSLLALLGIGLAGLGFSRRKAKV